MSHRPVEEATEIKEIVGNIQQCTSDVHAWLWSNFLSGQNLHLSAFRNHTKKDK